MRGKKAKALRRFTFHYVTEEQEATTYKHKKAKKWLAGPLIVWVSYPQRVLDPQCWRSVYQQTKKFFK